MNNNVSKQKPAYTDYSSLVHHNLQEHIKEKKISTTELQNLLSCGRTTAKRYKKGQVDNIIVLSEICGVLDLQITDMFKETTFMKPSEKYTFEFFGIPSETNFGTFDAKLLVNENCDYTIEEALSGFYYTLLEEHKTDRIFILFKGIGEPWKIGINRKYFDSEGDYFTVLSASDNSTEKTLIDTVAAFEDFMQPEYAAVVVEDNPGEWTFTK